MILPMVRVEVVGPKDRFRAALAFLQRRAVVELRVPVAPNVVPIRPEPEDDGRGNARMEEQIRRIDALVDRIAPSRGGRAEPLPPPGSDELTARLAALEGELAGLEQRRADLVQERNATTRFAQLVVALAPLGHDLDPGVEPEVHGLVLRRDPTAVALLEAEVRRLTEGVCEVKARDIDADTTGVLLVVPHAAARAVTELLFERGVEEVRLPSKYAGKRVVDVLFLLSARGRALPREIARADAALTAFGASARPTLIAARAAAAWGLDRRRAVARCGGTHGAFVIAGYMPAERVASLRGDADAELGAAVVIATRPPEPSEWGDVPVVLRNRAFVRPFERLLALVPLPRYGSVDPTPWLAVFFPLFFGLVLGDAAFGVLGIAAALVVRKTRWHGELGRDVASVALWCSASALFFGLLFGEALGELGEHAGLHPILLDRRHAFMLLLGVSLAVGALHVATGMVLGIASAVRKREVRHAIARAAKLLLLASALLAASSVWGVAGRGALVPAVAATVVFLVVAIAAEGPLAALDLVLGLGNVLSYARLMALGLASVMLAEVANHVATSLDPAAVGLTLGVLLHAVNFSLGLISPAIAALRLQYVEFFEKFYDEGGFPFRPFGVDAGVLDGAARARGAA